MKSETKKLTVEVTYKQHEWVEHLASDLRGTKSEVVSGLIQKEIDAEESGDAQAYKIRRIFELMTRSQPSSEILRAQALLQELEAMLDIAYKEDEARDLRVRLQERRRYYDENYGGSKG